MDPQATFATLFSHVVEYDGYMSRDSLFTRPSAKAQHEELKSECAEVVIEYATCLRDWLACGGFAPTLTASEKTFLVAFTFTPGDNAAANLVRECLRLINAAN